MGYIEGIVTIVGLTGLTIATRGFFFLTPREVPFPQWLQQGLRYAPLAALAAVVAPEVVLTQGELISTWRDARLFAVLAAGLYFWKRRDLLGTILTGMAVMLSLRLGMGW